MKVVLSKLPRATQQLIPMSIRSAKDIYDTEELPPKIRQLVLDSLEHTVEVKYNEGYDFVPIISKYSDLYILDKVKNTIGEYLSNYLYISPGSYPFDPEFGCRLKQQLQTRDTQLRKILISDQINQIVNAMTSDLGIEISIKSIEIGSVPTTLETHYQCTITVAVPGEEDITLTLRDDINPE